MGTRGLSRPFVPAFTVWFVCLSWLSCLLLSGCLTSRGAEIRLSLNEDGRSGSALVTFYDIESDRNDPDGRNADFREIISNWSYTANPADLGIAVDRKLWVDAGRLNGSYRDYFVDLPAYLEGEECIMDAEGFHAYLDPGIEIETNGTASDWTGRVERTDSTFAAFPSAKGEEGPDHRTLVSWPPGTREFWVKITEKEDDEEPAPDLTFAGMFEEYLEHRPPFDTAAHSVLSHLEQFSLYGMLGKTEEKEAEAREVCEALARLLAAPDPDPGVLLRTANTVRNAGLCPDGSESAERLAREISEKNESEP